MIKQKKNQKSQRQIYGGFMGLKNSIIITKFIYIMLNFMNATLPP